jgi:hypothetical protein
MALATRAGEVRREHLYLLGSGPTCFFRRHLPPDQSSTVKPEAFPTSRPVQTLGTACPDVNWKCCISELTAIFRQSEHSVLILLIVLILVFGFGGYRMGPGIGYYGGGGISLVLTIVVILLLLKLI